MLAILQGVTVEAGGDVSYRGRVVGSYLGQATAHGSAVYLVDGTATDAEEVRTVLLAQGKQVVLAQPDDLPAAVRAVIAVLKR
jgi:hypothetical protein